MSREVFRFDLQGLDVMLRELDNVADEIQRRVDSTLLKLAHKIIHDGKRLAPLDEGDLEAELIVGELKQLLGISSVDFGTTPGVDHYATVQHEGYQKLKDGRIVEMTPGEKTLSKGSYNGYEPGKKFLENAIKMNERLIMEELSKVLQGG